MRPILVIEQEESLRGLGLLGERLRARDVPHVAAQAWRDDLGALRAGDFSGIVPLGGAAHAWDEAASPWLRRERELLASAHAEGVPVLGICLGGQVLARALGARVFPADAIEVGWLEVQPTAEASGDAVLGHLREPTGVYQWHHDVFDLPDGAVRLASSRRSPNQAFRVGRAWGLQFHPEVDAALWRDWITWNPGACERVGIGERELDEAVRVGAERSRAFTAGIFDAFADVAAGAR